MSIDLWLFKTTGSGETPLGFGDDPKACTGVLTLVNRFTLIFLTEVGTSLTSPGLGTDVGSLVNNNFVPSEAFMKSIVYPAFSDAVEIIKNNQATASDERLDTAVLNSVSFASNSLSVDVTLTSEAGSSQTIKVPLSRTSR